MGEATPFGSPDGSWVREQWNEITGAHERAFAAKPQYKLTSALSQECEVIRCLRDLLTKVECKEHVAKDEMASGWKETDVLATQRGDTICG